MPLFNYKCKNNHESDHIVKYDSREEPQICPECGESSYFKQTFCTNVQYHKDYNSYAADTKRWTQRENHRLGRG